QSLESVFGHPAELSGSTCDHLIFKRQLTITWVVGASHTGVEMDLLKSRFNIGANLVLGFCHRLLSRFILPAVVSQVVSAYNYQIAVEVALSSQLVDVKPEVERRHSGVAAKLVNLIGRGLNEKRAFFVASQV